MMNEVRKNYMVGVTAVLLSATCFALTSILIKSAYNIGLSPLEVLALQSWIASFLLLVNAIVFKHEIFKVSRRTLGLLAFQGLVGSLGTSILYAYALLYLPVSVAILLLYLYPVLVLGAGVAFWHKPVRKKEILALLLTVGGTAVASGIFTGVTEVSWFGILLGLASAVAYAVFNLAGEMAVQKVSPLASMSFAQWFSSLGLLVFLWDDLGKIPWQSPEAWGIGLAMATVASIFPFYLVLVGIKQIGASQAAILSTFELPMTFMLAAILLNEIPTWNQGVGGLLVLGGITILNWRSRKWVEEERAS